VLGTPYGIDVCIAQFNTDRKYTMYKEYGALRRSVNRYTS